MEKSQIAKVPSGVKILPEISIVWVGWTNVTDRETTDDRQTDGQWHKNWHPISQQYEGMAHDQSYFRIWHGE